MSNAGVPEPLVSVVIPVYNGALFMAAALDSVFAQEYRPLDVVVVDDGSSDGSMEIAQAYPEARYLRQSNQGNAAARNAGIAAAHGEFIALLDQDDVWTPDKLRLQVDYLLAHTQVGYVVTELQPLLEPGMVWPAALNQTRYASSPVAYTPSALLARRSILEQVGLFDTSYTMVSDVDWFLRAQDAGAQAGVLRHALVHKRIHLASQSFEAHEIYTAEFLRAVRAHVQRQRSSAGGSR